MSDQFGDGANLYAYLGSSPWGRHDAGGLSWDPFDMVDDVLATRAASVASFYTQLGDAARTIATVTATIMSYLPFPGASFVGDLALAALEGRPLGPALMAAAVGLIPGGQLIMLVGSIATQYATIQNQKNGGELIDQEVLEALAELDGGGGGGAGTGAGGGNEDGSGEGNRSSPALAGLTSTVAHALQIGMTIADVFENGLGETPSTHVYIGKNSNGHIVYVGITNDFDRRQMQHGSRFEMEQITTSPVTRYQARAIETAAMTRFGSSGSIQIQRTQFQNKSRSIGPKRAMVFQAALSYGAKWLGENAAHLR